MTLIASSSSFVRRRSSLRVLDLTTSIAGKTLLSCNFRLNTNSIFPVPLNSSYTTSSILEPVSTSAVASIVRLPASRVFRAAPKKRFGIYNEAGSSPPLNVLPLPVTVKL